MVHCGMIIECIVKFEICEMCLVIGVDINVDVDYYNNHVTCTIS